MRYVLVHGFSQSARSWDRIVPELSQHAEVVALDVPDGLDFVRTAHALGDAGGHGTYVGYSMGGRLCLRLALDRPELVERLVLMSATAGIADDAARAAWREHDEALVVELEQIGVDAFLERWLSQPMFAALDAEAAGLDDRKRANTIERLRHQLRALGQGTQEPVWNRLGELAMPVLLLAGERDGRYSELAVEMCGAMGPNAIANIARGAGHALHLELEPARVASFITTAP